MRRLDAKGRREARLLVEVLAGQTVERIVSSPYARCVETVEPIAASLGLELELRDELAPDARRAHILGLLRSLPESALVCTHREVVEQLFGGEVTCEKGGTWILERHRGAPTPAAYLPAPGSKRTRRPELV